MAKIKTLPHLYILFWLGFKPKVLIKRGYNSASVYNYHRRYIREVEPMIKKELGVK